MHASHPHAPEESIKQQLSVCASGGAGGRRAALFSRQIKETRGAKNPENEAFNFFENSEKRK
jgi:hypothetical protein